MSHKSLWYWKKNGKVTGPFAEGLIQQYIILKRVHPNDELSRDKKIWRKASTIYELIPDVIRNKNDENYDERLKAAKRWADDRSDSRENLVDESFNQREKMTHLGIYTPGWKTIIVLIFILLSILYASFYFTPDSSLEQVDCHAELIAKVNLQGCKLSAKDFSERKATYANLQNAVMKNVDFSKTILSHSLMQYGDLSDSNLSATKLDYSDLTGAILNRAILNGTDLSYANLSYANLQYAKAKNITLKGANLSKTIWFNGQICEPGSIGRCLIKK